MTGRCDSREAVGMSGAEVLDVGRDAIWLTLQLSAPILLVGLAVGVDRKSVV